MTNHNGQRPCIDNLLPYGTVSLIIFLHRQAVYRRYKMLISFIDTISRETAKLNTLVDEVLAYVKACRHV